MKALSSLVVRLSLVFGCLLLALIAEIFYLRCWKKRVVHGDIEGGGRNTHTFCWTKSSSLTSTALNPHEICSEKSHSHLQSRKDHILLKPFDGDEGIETELMKLYNLTGPPRFLFTIKEETKEDLVESENGKSRKGRSLCDVVFPVETLILNPLFESSIQDELARLRSSPPPKFKFLRDAEYKLYKNTPKEQALRAGKDVSFKDSANLPASADSPTNLTYTNLGGQVLPMSSSHQR